MKWGDALPPCSSNPTLFDSEHLPDHREAKRLCDEECTIRDWCMQQLLVAQAEKYDHYGPRGTWAGQYVGRSGVGVMPKRSRAECGTPSGYKRHLHNGEETCRACRDSVNQYRSRGKQAS